MAVEGDEAKCLAGTGIDLDINQEAHETLKEAPDDLRQLHHHAWCLLPSFTERNKKFGGQRPGALIQAVSLSDLQLAVCRL